jgi:hypothetical protein
MENEQEQEAPQTRFEKQIGYDEVALTRSEIMESRGYETKKKGKKSGK